MRPVYISSNAFPVRTVDAIFAECDRRSIQYLELGSGVAHDGDARKKIIQRSRQTTILLHNYIPAPAVPFVLNLASPDEGTRLQSLELVKTALEISAEIGAPFYGVHSGFAYHADPAALGKQQTHLEHFPIEEARRIFEETVAEAADYARGLGVELLVENNVLPAFNLIDGRNQSYLLADIAGSVDLLEKFSRIRVRLLLDTGHLTVSAAALGFDREAYLQAVTPYVAAFQISDNDGTEDQHLPVGPASWSLHAIARFPNAPVTLEVNQHLGEVVKSLALIS